ncbi:hypothetical protein TNCT_103321 [Trichonephila clavata]|uniref:Uncharacterized protein n=1 Tax=Trichonephila clavata TaxID=2740835 RepID=A0A8X6FV48_TRICU|nr:hypothetical protein TNCT_103321 [Trichonephila clavata]
MTQDVVPLSKDYSSFQKASQFIAEDMTQKLQVIHEAKCLLKDLSKKENIVMAEFGAVVFIVAYRFTYLKTPMGNNIKFISFVEGLRLLGNFNHNQATTIFNNFTVYFSNFQFNILVQRLEEKCVRFPRFTEPSV